MNAASKRQKVTAEPILKSYQEVDEAIREFTLLQLNVEAIENAKQKAIDKIKGSFEEKAGPLMSKIMRIEKDLEDFHLYHKEDFEKARSRKLTFGTVGFRASSEVKYLTKWTAKKVLAKLKELGRVEFIKTTESVKKAEIKSSGLDAKIIAGFGCCIQEKDTFFFEPDRSAIANAKNKLGFVRKAS